MINSSMADPTHTPVGFISRMHSAGQFEGERKPLPDGHFPSVYVGFEAMHFILQAASRFASFPLGPLEYWPPLHIPSGI